MIISLLGTVRDGGKVHLAHPASDRFAEDRITYCTDNNTAAFQRAITTVLGRVHDGGDEALLATLHGLDVPPDRLCAVCFVLQWRQAYRAQWDSRTRWDGLDTSTMVLTTEYPAYVTDLRMLASSDDQAAGFEVHIAGSNPDLFPDTAHTAARALAHRLGWNEARLTDHTMLIDNQLGSFVYTRADTFNSLLMPDSAPVHPSQQRAACLGYDPGSTDWRGPIVTSREGTVTITWCDEPLIGIDTRAGTVLMWPDGENAQVVARFDPAAPPEWRGAR